MKMIGRGDQVNELYILDSDKFSAKDNKSSTIVFHNSTCNVSFVVNNVNARIWHHKLGQSLIRSFVPQKTRFVTRSFKSSTVKSCLSL